MAKMKTKKKNPCWDGYTALDEEGKLITKKGKDGKPVPACRPIKKKKK
jgi:hypothetical protein